MKVGDLVGLSSMFPPDDGPYYGFPYDLSKRAIIDDGVEVATDDVGVVVELFQGKPKNGVIALFGDRLLYFSAFMLEKRSDK